MIDEINAYDRWIKRKTSELAERLAGYGVSIASIGFSKAIYTGFNDAFVSVEQRGENKWVVKADGESVLFIEYGTGIRYGSGHPDVGEFGPGTWSDVYGRGHWDDPKGWWLPKEKGGEHTYGNPPNAPMYNAVKALEQDLPRIVREVFSGD